MRGEEELGSSQVKGESLCLQRRVTVLEGNTRGSDPEVQPLQGGPPAQDRPPPAPPSLLRKQAHLTSAHIQIVNNFPRSCSEATEQTSDYNLASV